MKKKLIYAGAFLAALLVIVGIIFLVGGKATYNKIKIRLSKPKENVQEQRKLYASNLELEELAQTLNACKLDRDCIHVPLSPCPCEQGGAVGAINKIHKNSFLKQIPSLENVKCSSFNGCIPENQKPVCYEKKCYVSGQTLLSDLLRKKDVQGAHDVLVSASAGIGSNGEIYFADIIASPLSEEEKISLAALLVKLGVQPKLSWYDWMLNNGQLELAKFFVDKTSMKKTIGPGFFMSYYNNRPDETFILDADPVKQEQKRRFPLDNGFALECGDFCVETLTNLQKRSPNGEKTKLFLMALGTLPKENLNSRRLEAEVARCKDTAQPCGSVKKAFDRVAPYLVKNAQEQQAEKQTVLPLLSKYRVCRQSADCEAITFGSCSKTTVATAVNKKAKDALLKDGALLRNMQELYGKKDLRNWCSQQTAAIKESYNVDCRKKVCVAHPTKPLDIIVL